MHSYQLLALRDLQGRMPDIDGLTAKITPLFSRIETEGTNLLALMENPDPMKSSMAIDLLINAEKGRIRDLVAKAGAEVNPLIASYREKTAAARLNKAALVPDQHAQEMRGVFRTMADEQQNNLLDQSMKTRDSTTIAALTEAPAILSGLTVQRQQQIRDAYLNTIAPSADNEIDELWACVSTFLSSAAAMAALNGSGRPSGSTA